MRALTACFVSWLFVGSAFGQPSASEWEQAGYDQSKQLQASMADSVSQLERNLKIMRTDVEFSGSQAFVTNGKRTYFRCENKNELKTAIEEAKKEILRLKNSLFTHKTWSPPVLGSLQVGQFGYVRTEDSKSAIPVVVVQIIDPKNALVKLKYELCKLEHDFEGLVDGKAFILEDPVVITGTTTYTAVVGTNTVFQAKSFKAPKVDVKQADPEERVWQDVTKKFSVTASLVSFDGKIVTLRKSDKSQLTLPLSKLSKADRQYVEETLGLPEK